MNKKIFIEHYLQETIIPLRLSTSTSAGWPIVLSLWYLYAEGALFCATTQQAYVVKYLRREPRCGFEIAADQPPYCGIRGRAVATIDTERGFEILERLLVRYLGNSENPLAKKLLSRTVPEVAIRLDIQSAHTWNFTNRMIDSINNENVKICPE